MTDPMENSLWWQKGIIYQIYPRSFQDSSGSGVGDLRGIIDRLDYLKWLGIDVLWISPFYPSPMKDFGYDISNYTAVHPMFGDLDDFDELVAAVHKRDMYILVDYVPNHTSDQHPWFQEARRSRDSPKRDWYLWKDPAPDGGPPTNWLSNFGGSAWALEEQTGQYYYHAYLPEQPDLNWRHPEVQEAMLDVMRFWLDRDVDGFRIDVMWHIIKDDEFRNNPLNPDFQAGDWPYRELQPVYTTDRPEVHDIIGAMRDVLDHYGKRIMVAEIYLPIERLVTYYGSANEGAHLPFNFHLIESPWDAQVIRKIIDEYEGALPAEGWPNWVLGNHDKHRVASRIGQAQARVAAVMLLTLRGTPTLYYGDEIGMHDVPIPPDQVHDPWEKRTPGLGLGRDPERTPMQWDDGPNAGFTTGIPWLPISEDHAEVNVAKEKQEPASLLMLYRRLIELRRQEPALAIGIFKSLEAGEDMLAYLRECGDKRFMMALNFMAQKQTCRIARVPIQGRIRLSTHQGRESEEIRDDFELKANEAVVIELRPPGPP